MRTKKVNRYWCDFCNKAGLASHAMAKHEKHCTMNLDRKCRVCALMEGGDGEGAAPLPDLIALLPEPVELVQDSIGNPQQSYMDFCASVDAAVPVLRAAADNCPACMMAALRQKKIPVPMAGGFDFKAEMRVVLDDYNQQKNDEGYY